MAPTKKAQETAPPEPDEAEQPAEAERVDEPRAAELPVMSAGVASDLAQQGWAGDPATGGMWRKDAETGEITYTPRQA